MLEMLGFSLVFFLSIMVGVSLSSFVERKINLTFVPVYIVVGIVVTTLIAFIIGFLKIPFIVALLFLIGIIIWRRNYFQLPKAAIKQAVPVITFSLLVILILGSIGFFQGYKNGDLVFFNENEHDGFLHIALQNVVSNGIPPENPIFAGEILKGYHYLADLYWGFLSSTGNLATESIYTIFMPIFLTFLFAISTLSLFSLLTKNKVKLYLISSILVFGSGLSYLVPFIFGASNNQSVFWLDQPVGYVINPHLLLSFSIFNVLLIMYLSGIKKWRVFFGIVLGSLAAIKVYAFLTLGFSFGLLAVYQVVKKRDWGLFVACAASFVVALLLMFLSQVGKGFPFIFEPGWFIKTMFETSDHLNYSKWELQRQTFAANSNYLRLSIHWVFGFCVWIVGNYGLKVMGLVLLPLILLRKIKSENKELILFCVAAIFIGILIPTLVIQKGVVWSSIQFLHYAQLPLCILIFYATERLKIKTQYFILMVILIFGLPTTIQSYYKTIDRDNYVVISKNVVEGLKYLSNSDSKKTIYALGEFKVSSIVPALSAKSTYFADRNTLEIIDQNMAQRSQDIEDIETNFTCPKSGILVAPPDLKTDGLIKFQNHDIRIIECQ